jgi:uncharacterized protein (TIGR02266 family)
MNREPSLAEQRPSEDPSERRRCTRHEFKTQVTLVGSDNFYMGLSENISEGGLFVATHALVPVGTRISLSFTLPGSGSPINVHGEVRWVRSPGATASEDAVFSGEDASLPSGMGIRFCELHPEDAKRIAKFLLKREPVFYDE